MFVFVGTSSGASLLRTVHRLISRNHPSSHPPALPTIAPINIRLSTTLTEKVSSTCLIDFYFGLYHPLYPIVHEGIFRFKCNNLEEMPENSHWKTLFYMVTAMGAFCAYSGSPGEDEALDLKVWNLIRQELTTCSILESGTLERVQTLTLMVCLIASHKHVRIHLTSL
jgi:transcriptional regulatory protein GAL4